MVTIGKEGYRREAGSPFFGNPKGTVFSDREMPTRFLGRARVGARPFGVRSQPDYGTAMAFCSMTFTSAWQRSSFRVSAEISIDENPLNACS